jgi:hypothetical protein
MSTAEDDGRKLVNALFKHFGTGGIAPRGLDPVTYEEAILEMKEHGGPWKQVEWPGHYLKWKLRQLMEQYYPGEFEAYSKGRLHLVKGIASGTVWDLRFNPYGKHGGVVPFMSFGNLNDILDEFGGLGLIVANSYAEVDFGDEVFEWHEDLKGSKSEYTIEREGDSERQQWKRKRLFFIIDVPYYYFSKDDFLEGYEKGWLDQHFQGRARQSGGGGREPKPQIVLHRIPPNCFLEIVNFNFDPQDFADRFEED